MVALSQAPEQRRRGNCHARHISGDFHSDAVQPALVILLLILLEAIMTSDLCKLAFAALAVSGLAISLLAATTATALAGL